MLQKLLNDCVAVKYSWRGKKQKKTFITYKYIVKLVLGSVHAACSEKGIKSTDMEVVNACGKWLAQTKTRIMRAEMKMSKEQDVTAVDQAV